MDNSGLNWQRYLVPRAALLVTLLTALLGSFGFSVYQASVTLREAGTAQANLARAAAAARDAQRLEVLSADLGGWLAHYALDVSLGGTTSAAGSVYAQSFGSTLSELTAMLGELRRNPTLDPSSQTFVRSVADALTRLNVLDVQIRDAYARGSAAGRREGTALVRGEAFTTNQELASSASALSRRVVQQAHAAATVSEQVAQAGSRRLIAFTVGAAVLLLILAGLVWEVLRKREQVVQQLRDLAARDGLTGVANRRHWDDLLARAAARAHAARTPLSVALIDLDHFKAFNDLHGHQAGDDQLAATARYLTEQLGGDASDRVLVARYGGEEFGVLHCGLEPAALRDRLDALRAGMPGGLSFSAGVAALGPDGRPEGAVWRADQALYCAKRAGRARTQLDGDGRCATSDTANGDTGLRAAHTTRG